MRTTRYQMLPHARVGGIAGLLELLHDRGGREDLFRLSEELVMDVEDLLPILEACALLGFAWLKEGDVQITPRDLMQRSGAIFAMVLFNVTPEGLQRIAASIGAGLENGTLRPVVGKEIPLAEAARAHKEVMEPGAYGKIVLVP